MHKAQENKIKESAAVGEWAIAGVKDQKTKHVTVTVVPNAKRETLCKLDLNLVESRVTVYTNDATAYFALVEFDYESVKYSVGQDVRGLPHHTYGIAPVYAQSWLCCHLPQDPQEALAAIHQRLRQRSDHPLDCDSAVKDLLARGDG